MIVESIAAVILKTNNARLLGLPIWLVRLVGEVSSTALLIVNPIAASQTQNNMRENDCGPCFGSEYLWVVWFLFTIGVIYKLMSVLLIGNLWFKMFTLKKKMDNFTEVVIIS